jgi:hypothetical protein
MGGDRSGADRLVREGTAPEEGRSFFALPSHIRAHARRRPELKHHVRVATDPFQRVVPPDDELDDRFASVAEHPSSAPARTMFRRIFDDFSDPDGNFLEQFQTRGFDARTWELALFAYLRSADFEVDRHVTAPDFLCRKGDIVVAVEATTANPSGGDIAPTTLEGLQRRAEESPVETLRRIEHEMPIRLGSALFSKLNRKYWELDHVAGLPLVFAIESFAADDALHFGDVGLAAYLYGLWATPARTLGGDLIVLSTPLTEHRIGDKVIPSNFFGQPGAEHVSAILFGNTGTFPKFGRMVVQGRPEATAVRMFRVGWCYDHDPNASEPLWFAYDVAERPRTWGLPETWGEGMSMFHNPNASIPIRESLFPDIAHHGLEDGHVTATIPPFHPFISLTWTVATTSS